jgi:hypothetical protein
MKFVLKLPLPWSVLCLAICLSWLCVSCASRTDNVQTVEVIPRNSDGGEYRTHGFLVVNTPTELHFDERSVRRYPHTGYSIYDVRSHRLIRYVPNHLGQAGESPSMVLLQAGNYMIEARTTSYRPIQFPVVIRPDTQTTVSLDSDVAPRTVQGGFYAIEIRGRPVGWISEARAQ